MSVNRLSLILLGAAVVVVAFGAGDVRAQGCVASRMAAPDGPTDPEGNSYYLVDSHWQASFGYRNYKSHRHFVGDVEQNAENVANGTAERDRSTSEVINKANLADLGISYGISDRLSINAVLPVSFFRRSGAPNAPATQRFWTKANGIGDLNILGRYWVADPTKHSHQNLSVGLGFKLPTGNDEAQSDTLVSSNPDGSVKETARRAVDQSIQPGDGGFGLLAEFQAFKSFGKFVGYASAQYLANPREQNDFLRNPTNPPKAGDEVGWSSAYLSVADQYAARLGVATTVKKFGLSLGARMEGVPSSDLIGGDLGRRRPGYSIAIEPGVSYNLRGTSLSLSVPYLVRRVRTQNYSDKLATELTGKHTQGDAAFADYMIVAGITRRF